MSDTDETSSPEPAIPPRSQEWQDALPNDRLAHLVNDAARAFSRALQLRLELHSVPLGYWKYLRILWESDGLTQQELSVRAGLTPATTSLAIKGMEALEYIVWTRLPSNRKNIYVYLTPKGRALKAKLVPLAEDVNNISIRGLKPAQLTVARQVLGAILMNLAEDEKNNGGQTVRRPSTREIGRRVGIR